MISEGQRSVVHTQTTGPHLDASILVDSEDYFRVDYPLV